MITRSSIPKQVSGTLRGAKKGCKAPAYRKKSGYAKPKKG